MRPHPPNPPEGFAWRKPPNRSHPEVHRIASKTDAGPIGAKKLAQHSPSSDISAKKLAQQAQKRRIWANLSALGELLRTFAMTQRRRANIVAHQTRHHGDIETNNTTAHPQQRTTETGITTAPKNRTKNTHFSHAKAMPVSTPHSHT